MARPLYIYVDVDETLVRNYGTKRIPIPSVINHVKKLFAEGATLYCWSSGGAEYARESAKEFGIEACFTAFLPKPQIMIDDVSLTDWRHLKEVHPNTCDSYTLADYRKLLFDYE